MNLKRRMISYAALAAVVSVMAGTGARAELTFSTWTRIGDNKTVVQFTAGSGTWTIPSGVSEVELLVVGGGGGSYDDQFQSGSGAGGLYYSSSFAVTPGDIAVTVGAGGVQGTGSSSVFGSRLTVFGGTPGNGYTDGGDQGAYVLDSGTVAGNPGMHYSPMDGNWCSGGGAGHEGYKGDVQLGGIGVEISITGTALWYAGGGGAPSSYGTSTNPLAVGYSGTPGYVLGGGGSGPSEPFGPRAFSGLPNTGGGSGGGWGGYGGTGGSGVVVLAYAAVPVPEPSTMALACCGVAFGAVFVRRRRQAG